MNRNKQIILFLFLLQMLSFDGYSSVSECYARMDSNILSIGNSKIERNFKWNNGQLVTLEIRDKLSGKSWINQYSKTNKTDLKIPGISGEANNAKWSSSIQPATPITPAYLLVSVEYHVGSLFVKRTFKIFPETPAIVTDTYLKSETFAEQWNTGHDEVIDQLSLPGKHWYIEAVEFFDTSDMYNTLVNKTSNISYRVETPFRGNLLFAHNREEKRGLFMLKEAPCSINQLRYPGYDFLVNYGTMKMVGTGIHPVDLQKMKGEWVKAYGSVTGLYEGDKKAAMIALREYQKKTRIFQEGRDNMLIMNTWGDRGDLERLTESFSIDQMKACAALGISHFQLDWGWQEGGKQTSSINIWSPKKALFPNGFNEIIKQGKQLGVELCLYFVPKYANNNASWEEDADALINLYKNHGVRIFKIDGQRIPTKVAEVNLRKMYEKVLRETDNNVVFNLDITNGPRGGYFYMNETGNLFVENRYTKFGTYYPYQTLRNLWMLSHFVAPERLNFEFLNKWKNKDQYPEDDPFAPANYSFDYLFAITMVAQPLAFFDAADLPVNPLNKSSLMHDYRAIQYDLQNGNTMPIGDEPSGVSWTGFQSIHSDRGYFIIYREDNRYDRQIIETFLEEGANVELQPLYGGKAVSCQVVGKSGAISFSLPEKNSFEIYKYRIR